MAVAAAAPSSPAAAARARRRGMGEDSGQGPAPSTSPSPPRQDEQTAGCPCRCSSRRRRRGRAFLMMPLLLLLVLSLLLSLAALASASSTLLPNALAPLKTLVQGAATGRNGDRPQGGGNNNKGGGDGDDGGDNGGGVSIIPESDLSHPDRKIWIITTASLPWMTGTAVNPLLRAAYLARGRPAGRVTLLIPWLDEADQKAVYPHGKSFAKPEDQEQYIRDWLAQRAGLLPESQALRIMFYTARYHPELGSIFSVGDVPALIPDEEADALILEEPEHLNWYRAPGVPWTKKFQHVVGICHTNYLVYSKSIQGGSMRSAFLFFMNQWMCRAYCHKVIKLSAALQRFAPGKEEVANVHGVRREFLEVGDSCKGSEMQGAYFIGKMLWPKGMDRLLPMMAYARERDGRTFTLDAYGSGPDEAEIKRRALARNLSVSFHGAVDHATLRQYKVFINPSVSEVLCTTVAEALAMGKFVIIADHASNEFFMRFTNCLTFRNKEEFATQVLWALAHVPAKLSPEERDMLTWEAATRRLLKASLVPAGAEPHSKVDKALEKAHAWVSDGSRGDRLRRIAGGDIIAEKGEPGPPHYANPLHNNNRGLLGQGHGQQQLQQQERHEGGGGPAATDVLPPVPPPRGQPQRRTDCCGGADCEALAGAGFGRAAGAGANGGGRA